MNTAAQIAKQGGRRFHYVFFFSFAFAAAALAPLPVPHSTEVFVDVRRWCA